MQEIMNRKIKFRESFRPFAPSCLEEKSKEYFDLSLPSPYMLIVAPVTEKRRTSQTSSVSKSIQETVNTVRSDIPAITHVDYSARVQTVTREHHPRFYDLIKAFEKRTGYGIIINTSFNIRGEPIVCTPKDAYRCFMCTEMDYLVLGSYLLEKNCQPDKDKKSKWMYDSVPD
jgi:carbamoyltransferase